ncbi:DnaJ domain-containing protein [Candidatus Wolfebacteria bacterium]|nr:DnaJ domain-containing protein [Candidatus Wolfebacteria bacterium]
MVKDYYSILGIDRGADDQVLKSAYRRLAMIHHPDRGGDAEKFKEVDEAYKVLSDSAKRARYDREGHERFSAAEHKTTYR